MSIFNATLRASIMPSCRFGTNQYCIHGVGQEGVYILKEA